MALDLVPGIADQVARIRATLDGLAVETLPLAVATRLYVLLDATRDQLEQYVGAVPTSTEQD